MLLAKLQTVNQYVSVLFPSKDVNPFDYGKTAKMDFRFVSDLVSILTHFFIKNRMKPMTAVDTKTGMNCFFRIASSETPLRSGYTEVDVRCKFIIKLDKPFGFDPESKTPDSARRFFCFENTQDSGGNTQDSRGNTQESGGGLQIIHQLFDFSFLILRSFS